MLARRSSQHRAMTTPHPLTVCNADSSAEMIGARGWRLPEHLRLSRRGCFGVPATLGHLTNGTTDWEASCIMMC